MAYNRSKLIVDIYQVLIKIITQQLQNISGKPKPSNAQLNVASILSNDLGTAIHNYVSNEEFVLSLTRSYSIPNASRASRTYWLKSTGGEVYSLYDTEESNYPYDSNGIISAVNYTRTISITSLGDGDMDARIFLEKATNDWFMVSRAMTFNTAYAIIPANTRVAVSMINRSSAAIQANISILKSGKTS